MADATNGAAHIPAAVFHVAPPVAAGSDSAVFGPQVAGDAAARLDDVGTVEGILRRFVGKVLAIRGAWLDKQVGDDEAADAVIAEARRVSDVFLGHNPDYIPAMWNSVEGVGQALVARLRLDCDPEDSVYVALMQLAQIAMERVDLGAIGALPSFLVAYGLDQGVRDTRDALLGFDMDKLARLLADRDKEARSAVARGMAEDQAEAAAAFSGSKPG